MLQHLIKFSLYYLSSGRLREIKNKRKFQTFSSKVVAVANEKWSLTRGSNYSLETFASLENWSLRRGGRNRSVDCINVKSAFEPDGTSRWRSPRRLELSISTSQPGASVKCKLNKGLPQHLSRCSRFRFLGE